MRSITIPEKTTSTFLRRYALPLLIPKRDIMLNKPIDDLYVYIFVIAFHLIVYKHFGGLDVKPYTGDSSVTRGETSCVILLIDLIKSVIVISCLIFGCSYQTNSGYEKNQAENAIDNKSLNTAFT